MAHIHFEQWPSPVAAGRRSVLDAALDAGVPFPHGCMSGECGRCKCQLLEGKLSAAPTVGPALTQEESASGLFLACQVRASGDLRCRWLAEGVSVPAPAPRKIRARVSALEQAAGDVRLLTLECAEALPFLPGQFARLRFGRLPARAYSMANQPGAHRLEFHIRLHPAGRVSNHVAHRLRAGDAVRVEGPYGDAHWRGADEANLLLLAGGTGLAPMLSVLDAALQDGVAPERIHIYHGVRSPGDAYAESIMRERARVQGFRFETIHADGALGRPLHAAVEQDFTCLRNARLYVAGPPPMIDAIMACAHRLGAAPERIHADAFHAAQPAPFWRRLLLGW